MSKNKTKYIIKHNSFKFRMPVTGLMACWLLLDRFKAPDLVFGGFYVLVLIVIIAWIYAHTVTDEIEVDIQKLLKKYYFDTKQNEDDETDGPQHPN